MTKKKTTNEASLPVEPVVESQEKVITQDYVNSILLPTVPTVKPPCVCSNCKSTEAVKPAQVIK